MTLVCESIYRYLRGGMPSGSGYGPRKYTHWHEFKSRTRLSLFQIAPIDWEKIRTQLFSLGIYKGRLGSLALVWQPFLEKENSESNPVKLWLKTDYMPHSARAGDGWYFYLYVCLCVGKVRVQAWRDLINTLHQSKVLYYSNVLKMVLKNISISSSVQVSDKFLDLHSRLISVIHRPYAQYNEDIIC